MKATIYYALSCMFDFPIIAALCAACVGVYNAIMLAAPVWILWAGIIIVIAALCHQLSIWFLEDAIYYATPLQIRQWDL